VTVRTRLLLAQAPLALGLALVGLVAVSTLGALGFGSQRILRDNFRSVLAAQRMKDAAERIDAAAVARAAGQGRSVDAKADADTFESELQVQEGNITEPGEAEATRTLRAAWNDYLRQVRGFEQEQRDLQRRYFADLRPSLLRVRTAADRILEINQDAMLLKSEQARSLGERSRSLVLFATLAALALSLFASVSLTRRALRPLGVLSDAVRRIGEGDLDARARVPGEDEIAQVGRELDTMADRLREYRNSSLGELLQAQQASQAAIDSLPDPVLVLAVDGKVLNVNQAAETLLRIAPGREPLAGLPPPLRDAVDKVRAHVAAGKGAWAPRGLEEAIRDDAGRSLLPRATPLYSEQGSVSGVTIVLQDVTRLQRFDELKNDLVATVAHEFRTPLTSMRMAVHILLEGMVGQLNERQLDLVFAAREDCERLQGIVEDLLDLSRIQAGKVEVSLTPLPAKTLLDAAVQRQADAARAAGVRIEQRLVEPVLPVEADPERIALVFDNLIGNALRYATGRIEVAALPLHDRVRFEVADDGPGIPQEYQERIFEKFFRMPGAKGEGIGLGLYISREIVAAHGGEMGVESSPGAGSRFWFTLRVPSR
jgi:signal transduction histidine kinase/HAMP domain-containing protein